VMSHLGSATNIFLAAFTAVATACPLLDNRARVGKMLGRATNMVAPLATRQRRVGVGPTRRRSVAHLRDKGESRSARRLAWQAMRTKTYRGSCWTRWFPARWAGRSLSNTGALP
jgi:hypothetical protein